jgi:hypothetical protein
MFFYLNSVFGPNPRLGPASLPAHAGCATQPAGAAAQWFASVHPRSEAESDLLSESDLIGG